MVIWSLTAKFNFRQYFQLHGIYSITVILWHTLALVVTHGWSNIKYTNLLLFVCTRVTTNEMNKWTPNTPHITPRTFHVKMCLKIVNEYYYRWVRVAIILCAPINFLCRLWGWREGLLPQCWLSSPLLEIKSSAQTQMQLANGSVKEHGVKYWSLDTLYVQIPYSGKLSREKTFTDW